MKRAVDVAGALAGLILLSPLFLWAALAVVLGSPGPVLHWSQRVGRDERLFAMPKFRTMRIDTPQLATHLLPDPDRWVTPIGRFLRRTSLDELPQLWSILKGDMSLVGPRPALFNQDDLVALRRAAGVAGLRPGLTGWAQINGRDELPIAEKARLDAEYLARMSLAFDLRIIAVTAFAALSGRHVTH
ncbi:MAG: sugar transferase [Phenylobacterium sp.]|nr:sugar transferase [Phenylobacterium sp.]